MKKLLIVSVALLSLLAVGCGKGKEEKKANYEKIMEGYAEDYYTKFMNKTLTNPQVSIKYLKLSNEAGQTEYDLSKLADCTDESYTEIRLKEGTTEIDGYTHHLECTKK